MTIKIFFAIPAHNDMVYTSCVSSLLKSFSILEKKGILYKIKFYQGSLISRLRNEITNDFLKTDYTHLFFIDNDVSNFENIILTLLDNLDKLVIGGVYPKKQFSNYLLSYNIQNREPLFNTSTDFNINLFHDNIDLLLKDNIIKVRHIGTGCMLINKSVFEKLKEYVDFYRTPKDEIIFNFFGCYIDNERFLSEDYAFCNLCTKNNINVWAIIDINLNHEGSFTYKGNYLDYLKKFNIIKKKLSNIN